MKNFFTTLMAVMLLLSLATYAAKLLCLKLVISKIKYRYVYVYVQVKVLCMFENLLRSLKKAFMFDVKQHIIGFIAIISLLILSLIFHYFL